MLKYYKCLRCKKDLAVRKSINLWGEPRWVAVCKCAIYTSKDGIHFIPIAERGRDNK